MAGDGAGWGHLRGQFVFDGDPPPRARLNINKDVEVCGKEPRYDETLIVDEKTKGVMNSLVYLRDSAVRVHPEFDELVKKPAKMVNDKCRFQPHVCVVMVGQELVLDNNDPVGHNSNIQPLGDVPFSPLIPPNPVQVMKFTRSQTVPAPITCNIHPWEKGFVFIYRNQYSAVSKADGTFEIKNLPTGEREFQLWHEAAGWRTPPDSRPEWTNGRFRAKIEDGRTTDLGVIRLGRKFFAEHLRER